MANYMAEVAKLLGVELGEEFECTNRCTYKITNDGLVGRDVFAIDQSYCNAILCNLLNGSLKVRRKLWKPNINDNYYVVEPNGDIETSAWRNYSYDMDYYKLGNCYRTKAEAETNRDKWIAFYASDDVMEV